MVTNPSDPATLVSVADCRMMAFETVTQATKLWIKGRDFTVERLLGAAYKDQAPNYIGGALGIFRLAPQVRFSVNFVLGVIGDVNFYRVGRITIVSTYLWTGALDP